MALADDLRMYGMQQGCPVHGDDRMMECTMCGYEFCKTCFRNSLVCPDCAEEATNDLDEDEDEGDFEDIKNIDKLLGEDIDDLVDEDELDEIPAEDLVDDEVEEREAEVTPYEGEPPD